MLRLLLIIARFYRLSVARLEILRVRFETTFAQVLLSSQRNRDGDFQRRVLDEVITGAVARRGHVCVHVVSVLQLTLRVLRLQRVEIVQVAQLKVLIRPTSGLWGKKVRRQQTCQWKIRCHTMRSDNYFALKSRVELAIWGKKGQLLGLIFTA